MDTAEARHWASAWSVRWEDVVRLAQVPGVGIDGAVLITSLAVLNDRYGADDEYGVRWLTATGVQWTEWLPWWSERAIRRLLDHVCAVGIVVRTQRAAGGTFDRTFSYRIDAHHPALCDWKSPILPNGQMHVTVASNAFDQTGENDAKRQMEAPILPDGHMEKVASNAHFTAASNGTVVVSSLTDLKTPPPDPTGETIFDPATIFGVRGWRGVVRNFAALDPSLDEAWLRGALVAANTGGALARLPPEDAVQRLQRAHADLAAKLGHDRSAIRVIRNYAHGVVRNRIQGR